MPTKSAREVFDGFKLECLKCGPDAVVVEDEIQLGEYVCGEFFICCNRCGIRTKIVDLET
jgi:hypothetical protein